MDLNNYELINQTVDDTEIQTQYYASDKIFYLVERNTKGEHLYFFNPEFAFEKQSLVNADLPKLFEYLKAEEKFPEQYQQFLKDGYVYLKMNSSYLIPFTMHILKQGAS
jgi:hydroxymethylpyrimidine pyrophosphatase-like HAD family hydrolase